MTWFSDGDLRLWAGATWYERGLGYVDLVEGVTWSPDEVVASVRGTDLYTVRLSRRNGVTTGDCSCPWGREGNFCKHCVAVGVAALADAPEDVPAEVADTEVADVDLRGYLGRVDPAELVDLLVDLADRDAALRRLLSARAAGAGTPDAAELHRLVARVAKPVALHGAAVARWVSTAEEVVHALDVLTTDHPATTVALYQDVLRHLADKEVDHDAVAALRDVAARAVAGLVAACRGAAVDGVGLARWLYDLQVDAGDVPDVPVTGLAEALGEDGRAAYWDLLSGGETLSEDDESEDDEEEDEEYDEDDEDDGRHRRPGLGTTLFRLREVYLRDVARDVDALVALHAGNLADSGRHVRIGQVLRDAGRPDEAVAWLERGRAESRWGRDDITDLLVEVYAETGRHKEAARARWDEFERVPQEVQYRKLLRAAEPLDAVEYAKNRALAHLRGLAEGGEHADGDPLVTILVAVGEVDAAWEAAHRYPCSDRCLFQVARGRGVDHPADAIPVYAREVDAAIARKDRAGYARAAGLLAGLRDLHGRAGLDFAAYLGTVKAEHRRKSALLEVLAAQGL